MNLHPSKPWWKRRPFLTWDRFGLRHFLLWMTSVALMNALWRILTQFEHSLAGGGPLGAALLNLFQLAAVDRLDAQQAIVASGFGSLLGLGLPAVLARYPEATFWHHPGRVIPALFLTLNGTAWIASAFGVLFYQGWFEGSQLLMQMGAASTNLVFALYALMRSRLGILWRLALVLVVFMVCFEIIFSASELLNRMNSRIRITDWMMAYLALQGLLGFVLMVSGCMEWMVGKRSDWRTWIAALGVPVTLLCLQAPWIWELYRAYRLNNL